MKLKRPGLVAALARFGQHGEEFADRREDARVGRGIRARRAPDGRLVDLDHFVNLLGAFDRAERAGALHRAVERLRQRAIENVVHQRGFSRAGNARHDGEQAERQFKIHILQIIRFAAEDANEFAVRRAALGRHGNFQFAAQIAPRQRIGVLLDFFRAALGDQMPARVARAGAEVHHVVGAANGFLIVLDDEHGVAQVAQFFERGNQAVVVARVQADGRLVQHVEHAAQLRADLRRQANALRLAAGKRRGGAVQAEIAESDGEQKIEPRGNFGEGAPGNVGLPCGQARANLSTAGRASEIASAVNSAMDRPPTFTARLSGPQSLLAANRARHGRHVLRDPFAVRIRLRFLEIRFEKTDHALEMQSGKRFCGGLRARLRRRTVAIALCI